MQSQHDRWTQALEPLLRQEARRSRTRTVCCPLFPSVPFLPHPSVPPSFHHHAAAYPPRADKKGRREFSCRRLDATAQNSSRAAGASRAGRAAPRVRASGPCACDWPDQVSHCRGFAVREVYGARNACTCARANCSIISNAAAPYTYALHKPIWWPMIPNLVKGPSARTGSSSPMGGRRPGSSVVTPKTTTTTN